jgi:hypothetical protein
MRFAMLFALAISTSQCQADELLRISRASWNGLSGQEQAAIQSTHVVEIRESSSYGIIVDNQGINESTPGTSSGAALGSAVAQATYIDRAFKPGNNYSAKNQLGVAILGAMLGSALDKPAVQQYHFRYAVKTPSGEIQFLDSVQGSAFRLPAGLCVSVPDLTQISQGVCDWSAADLRRQFLPMAVVPEPTRTSVVAPEAAPSTSASPSPSSAPVAAPPPTSVICKLGNLPPINTSAEKCKSIGGEIL